jgi:hypothetical protein
MMERRNKESQKEPTKEEEMNGGIKNKGKQNYKE